MAEVALAAPFKKTARQLVVYAVSSTRSPRFSGSRSARRSRDCSKDWIRAPCTVANPSQFRVAPPSDLASDVWVRDYQKTKAYGGQLSYVRTEEQTDLARFVGGAGVHAAPSLSYRTLKSYTR
jgi:hypothetical protein